MRSNRLQSLVCAVVFCTVCTCAISLDSTPQPPLSVSNPISGDATPSNDLRRGESRFNNEPPPEFYKGPGSATLNRDRDRYGFQTSNDAEHRYDAASSTNAIPYGSSGYGGGRQWSSSGYGSSRDRISVGGVGSGYYGSSGLGSSGYGGYDRPRGPYGPPQAVDLPGGHYSHDSGYGGSGYGQMQDMLSQKIEHLSKSNLVPIASAALLGIAAAFIFNPVLLQLGTISAGKRRRRETSEQSDETESDESDYSHGLAYNGQKSQ